MISPYFITISDFGPQLFFKNEPKDQEVEEEQPTADAPGTAVPWSDTGEGLRKVGPGPVTRLFEWGEITTFPETNIAPENG